MSSNVAPIRRARRLAAVAVGIGLVAVACGSNDSLLDAAATLEPPSEFTQTDNETLNGFEAVTRQFTYTTNLSQRQACDLARQTLAQWTGDQLQERPAPPYTICGYEVRSPSEFGGTVDFAAARVGRARDDAGEFIEDDTLAGGVDQITIFFSRDK